MTPDEFADLVRAPRAEVDRYRSLGLLDPEGDQLLDDVDVVRFGYVRDRLGQYESDTDLAAAVYEGRIESMYGRRLFEASKPIEVEEAATRAGLEPDQLRQLLAALGFSALTLRESDVDFIEILRLAGEAGLPWDAILGITRVVGDSLRRIADSEIRAVHSYIHQRLSAAGVPEEEVNEVVTGIEQTVAPLMGPMLEWLHREYLLEASIEDAFFHLTETDTPAKGLGAVETTIVFVDVASYTALAETSGDEIAAQVLDRIDGVIRGLLVDRDGKLVKQIGDGFMLAFRDPVAAVRFAVATQAELARDAELPPIRVGINAGPALYRTSDYLGGAVNVASRVVNAAMPGQILLTEPVAVAARAAGIDVDEVGVRMMRGVDDPLALYRVRPAIARTAAAAG